MKRTLLAMLLAFPLFANAQLMFNNKTASPVFVAYAIYIKDRSYAGWYAQGWYSAAPGETITLNQGLGVNSIVYYYAKSTDGKIHSGNNNFYVHPHNPFALKNADMAYVLQENLGFVPLPFRQVQFKNGMLKTKYTIELSC